ncbi:hypothetical protein [Spirosoma validum]|uniref:Lasso RiPP family leader peptide-containing protein n=1 Tax=Spirosoma validum TaxID=2771355 RepID=A0A927B4N8_9BACT|nr:hypothetical protein [Spirosoma validum]MBD2755571.1 hypothetical protein [Spirosoma validum]
MIKNVQNKKHNSAKKAYQKPQLKTLGSVRQLTLKLGSLTDSGQAGQFV